VVDLLAMATADKERERWQACFHDMVGFNLAVSQESLLMPASADYRAKTQRDCRRFLRTVADLSSVRGDKLLAEPRFNPDGSVDILRWSRPQLDGPALRALACLAYLAEGGSRTPALLALLQHDLDFTLRQAGRRSIGPWEEPHEFAHHYQVALVQLGALVHGREFAGDQMQQWQRAENKLRRALEQHWSPQHQVFVAIRNTSNDRKIVKATATTNAEHLVDSAILLALLEADLPTVPHSVLDPRAVATLAVLEQAFAQALPINHQRTAGHAPALGRSLADRYFGGGAWYATTLAAAAFCFRHSLASPADAEQWRTRGDQSLATVRWMTPADGSMAEQVDRASKQPRSARHLSWSYAAFISTARLRERAFGLH
jgi:glucoamylase